MSFASVVTLEDGWAKIQNYILHLEECLACLDLDDKGAKKCFANAFRKTCNIKAKSILSQNNFAGVYTTVYNMCVQKAPHNRSEALHIRYKEAVVSHIQLEHVPKVRRLLSGIEPHVDMHYCMQAIEKFIIYQECMENLFICLDRYYVRVMGSQSLRKDGLCVFCKSFGNPMLEALRRWRPCDFAQRSKLLQICTQLLPTRDLANDVMYSGFFIELEVEVRRAIASCLTWVLSNASQTRRQLSTSIPLRQNIYRFLV